MTDLLSPRARRASAAAAARTRKPSDGHADDDAHRPLAIAALVAGAAAPLTALLALWAVGLVGWFASDGGSHGTTRSVLRVAADSWLLAHATPLVLRDVTITASPLGLTLACAYLTYRFGRRAGRSGAGEDLRSVGMAAVALAGMYAVVALLTSLLAATAGAVPGLGSAFVGGAIVGGLAGGAGLVRGAGLAGAVRRRIPVPVLSVGYAAVAVVVLLAAAGAVLLAVALAAHASAAANVAEGLRLDVTGALLSLLVLLLVIPNLALLAVGYLLGPGFAFGVGTVVSPAQVSLGPVPSVPVLAALPADGWAPGWAMALLGVPVLVAVAAAYLAGRAVPTRSYQRGALRGLAAGVVGSLLVTVATSFAGGAIGSGRMTEIGTSFWPVLVAGLRALAPGAALGGVLAVWWAHRHDVAEAAHPELAPPPPARPLAGPDDGTEPVHLPRVTAEDRLVPHPVENPSGASTDLHTDLAGEETVQLRLPAQRPGRGAPSA